MSRYNHHHLDLFNVIITDLKNMNASFREYMADKLKDTQGNV
ncbi:MAG TPA: hypothetical protein VHJ38_15725 [Nitrososphaeraceae archaeon]|nr:hypothetical protein [Nitrososphaeraceae archaeon]